MGAGILVEALGVVHAHFHRHALEELEGFAAQIREAHAPQVHNPDSGAQGQGSGVQHLPHVFLYKPKMPANSYFVTAGKSSWIQHIYCSKGMLNRSYKPVHCKSKQITQERLVDK